MIVRAIIFTILLAENQLEYLLLHLFLKEWIYRYLTLEKKKEVWKKLQIEGIIKPSENVLLVEDLMTDGGSKIKFIESILRVKAKIKAIFVIFNYGINIDFLEVNRKKINIIHLATWQDILNEKTIQENCPLKIKIK